MNVVLDAFQAPPSLRIASKVLGWPFQWLGYKGDPSMPPATRAITALGPAYIKFGQNLSTRPDLVGEDLAKQLRVLQDQLPPFPVSKAKDSIEKELGVSLDGKFSEFSDAVAAASIAQVHKARLADTGELVAVKVLRPGIERAFKTDIDAFYFAASMIEFLSPSSRRLRPRDVIRHFEGTVLGELDLRLESAAASEFSANTQNDPGFQVPSVKWDLSGRRVMTLSWVEGISLGNNEALDEAGIDRVELSTRVLQLFLQHALRDGYFHADMHQGNLKVGRNGDIIALDFGIMGYIDEFTRRIYAEILFGFIRRDYKRVAELHFEAGYVPSEMDVNEFARALRAVGEPIFGMDANRISMARLLSHLFEVTERFGMETRTELILLQRTMVVVEGVSRSLNPSTNIWTVAKPIVQDYIQKSIGPRAAISDAQKIFNQLRKLAPRLPDVLENLAHADVTKPTSRDTTQQHWLWLVVVAIVSGLVGALVSQLFVGSF